MSKRRRLTKTKSPHRTSLGHKIFLGLRERYRYWFVSPEKEILTLMGRWHQAAYDLGLYLDQEAGRPLDFHLIGYYRSQAVKIGYRQDGLPRGQLFTWIELTDYAPRSPDPAKAEQRLIILSERAQAFTGSIEAGANGRNFTYEQPGLLNSATDIEPLLTYLSDLAAVYPSLVAWGSEAITPLQAIIIDGQGPLLPVARQLLRDIAADTATRYNTRMSRVRCPNCLTHFKEYRFPVSLREYVSSYGCRLCGQSQHSLDALDGVVVVLDRHMTEEIVEVEETLRMNWLKLRRLFDFDRVEIIAATDEDVERFAVQVGNDTDETRRVGYAEIPCHIASDCELSANSHRILESLFG